MKPFDLQKALAGEPVVNGNGVFLLDIAHLPNAKISQRVIAVLPDSHGFPMVVSFYENGKMFRDSEDLLDLHMATQKKTVWVNLYQWPEGIVVDNVKTYDTEKEAKSAPGVNTGLSLGTYPIEIEI